MSKAELVAQKMRGKEKIARSIDEYVDMLVLAVETVHRMSEEGGEPLPDSP